MFRSKLDRLNVLKYTHPGIAPLLESIRLAEELSDDTSKRVGINIVAIPMQYTRVSLHVLTRLEPIPTFSNLFLTLDSSPTEYKYLKVRRQSNLVKLTENVTKLVLDNIEHTLYGQLLIYLYRDIKKNHSVVVNELVDNEFYFEGTDDTEGSDVSGSYVITIRVNDVLMKLGESGKVSHNRALKRSDKKLMA